MTFEYPFLLFFLLPWLGAVWFREFFLTRRTAGGVHASTVAFYHQLPPTWKTLLYPVVSRFSYAALFLLIVATARPQRTQTKIIGWKDGIDIVIVLDISESMLQEDFKPNRLEAAKQYAIEFIENREYDRIGLVLFKDRAFTNCPMTTDYRVLKNLIRKISVKMLSPGGTAIGTALTTGLSGMARTKAKTKIFLLLTDGRSNAGAVSPLAAARAAKALNIKIYAIGIGDPEGYYKRVLGVFKNHVPSDLDEELLKKIASLSGGAYYNAKDEKALQHIFQKINQLEKSRVNVQRHVKRYELFMFLLWPCVLFMMIEIFSRVTWMKLYGERI